MAVAWYLCNMCPSSLPAAEGDSAVWMVASKSHCADGICGGRIMVSLKLSTRERQVHCLTVSALLPSTRNMPPADKPLRAKVAKRSTRARESPFPFFFACLFVPRSRVKMKYARLVCNYIYQVRVVIS